MFFIGFYYPNHAVRWKRVKWRDGSKTRYLISNIGIVVNEKTGKIMKTNYSKGYERVCLTHNGQQKQFFVHVLVAKAFVKNPKNKPEVNHINGVKSANYDVNLEWTTRSENQIHAFKMGLVNLKDRDARQLSTDTMHKLCALLVENKKTMSQIAKEVGTTRQTVSRVMKKKHITVDGVHYDFSNYESKPVYIEFGEKNHQAKYTEADIENVCRLIDSGEHSIREVSDLSGIPYQVVRNVYYGTSWTQIASKYNFFKNKARVNEEKEKVVNKICDLLDEGYNTREVSEMLGVGRSMVRCIYSGQSWASLTKDRKFMKDKKSK